ncbi:NADP-dependent 3-hydroxy acid dehydrogenase YdfG [Thermomonospora echinospora]|uniref:NADP-dependent 3-hydroxy acid dehydrogenase YdfG n=1 Tax=Thermomonospora echinospora TaxID=1992 RepID=A0A1H6DH65_9ACTN|nr:SDR family oxidoreductase [Thermomonospora echinospora]SEG84502.1 NADP-dependent 3-hydroxy acid dehydrogenase YdfG [Thermomonospora echinospora]
MHADLRGKTALVTGAARGLGAAVTRRLGAAGAAVWAADIREDRLRDLCRELRDDGVQARPLVLDIRDAGQVAEAITGVYNGAGSVDVLVNNAAVDVTKPIEHLTAQEAGWVIGTNLLGPVHLCLETYRRMIKQGGGHIVNILSTAANRTWTEAGPYAASKTGLRAFTHTLFQEAQRDCPGIGVTGIIAGGMETPFITERFPDADTSRLQDPAIVADTVLYVLSVPAGSVIPELVVIPRNESSWP